MSMILDTTPSYKLRNTYDTTPHSPPIYLHLIFAILQFGISSLESLVWWTWFLHSLFQTWILQATAGRKIQFKLGKKSSSSNLIFQIGELQVEAS